MASQCCGCAPRGMVIAAMEVAIGVALAAIGPLLYGIDSCYTNYYNSVMHYYCYEDSTLMNVVAAEGGVCIFSGVLLFCGFGCRSVCTVRFSQALSSIAALGLIACGVLSLTYELDVGLAVILFVLAIFLFTAVGVVSSIDTAVRPIAAAAAEVIITVPTPAPQQPVILQPNIQNNYINQVSNTSNMQTNSQAPATQPLESPHAPPLIHPSYNRDQSPPPLASYNPDQSPPPLASYNPDQSPPPLASYNPHQSPPPLASYNPHQPPQPQLSERPYMPPHGFSYNEGPPTRPYYSQAGTSAHPTNSSNTSPLQNTSDPQKPPLPNDGPTNLNANYPSSMLHHTPTHNEANPQGNVLPSPMAHMNSGLYPPTRPYSDQFDPRRSSMYSAHPPAHNYPNPQGGAMSPPRGGMNSGLYPPPTRPYDDQFDPRRRSMYSAHPPAQRMYSYDNHRNSRAYPSNSGHNAYPPRY